MTRSPSFAHSWGRNLFACLVAATALGLSHLNFDPEGVGSAPTAIASSIAAPTMTLPPSPALPERLAGDNSPVADVEDPTTLRGIWALKMVAGILEKGCKSFGETPDYTATLFKQERIGGVIGDGQTIELKIRHEPFSVYMKWLTGERGQQLIYVDGLNAGKMLVQPGGIKGRLTGVMALDLNGALAMSQCRYPANNAGLHELAKMILAFQHKDIERGTGFQCELRDDQTFADRPCYLFTCQYENPQVNPLYRKAVIFVDRELSMPVCVKNYTWPTEAQNNPTDDETLIEFYAYTDLKIKQKLTHTDFDQANSDYRMRIR